MRVSLNDFPVVEELSNGAKHCFEEYFGDLRNSDFSRNVKGNVLGFFKAFLKQTNKSCKMQYFALFSFGLLTLLFPCISESCIGIKIKLNFYFHTSLWCLKWFYEGLKGLHKTF